MWRKTAGTVVLQNNVLNALNCAGGSTKVHNHEHVNNFTSDVGFCIDCRGGGCGDGNTKFDHGKCASTSIHLVDGCGRQQHFHFSDKQKQNIVRSSNSNNSSSGKDNTNRSRKSRFRKHLSMIFDPFHRDNHLNQRSGIALLRRAFSLTTDSPTSSHSSTSSTLSSTASASSLSSVAATNTKLKKHSFKGLPIYGTMEKSRDENSSSLNVTVEKHCVYENCSSSVAINAELKQHNLQSSYVNGTTKKSKDENVHLEPLSDCGNFSTQYQKESSWDTIAPFVRTTSNDIIRDKMIAPIHVQLPRNSKDGSLETVLSSTKAYHNRTNKYNNNNSTGMTSCNSINTINIASDNSDNNNGSNTTRNISSNGTTSDNLITCNSDNKISKKLGINISTNLTRSNNTDVTDTTDRKWAMETLTAANDNKIFIRPTKIAWPKTPAPPLSKLTAVTTTKTAAENLSFKKETVHKLQEKRTQAAEKAYRKMSAISANRPVSLVVLDDSGHLVGDSRDSSNHSSTNTASHKGAFINRNNEIRNNNSVKKKPFLRSKSVSHNQVNLRRKASHEYSEGGIRKFPPLRRSLSEDKIDLPFGDDKGKSAAGNVTDDIIDSGCGCWNRRVFLNRRYLRMRRNAVCEENPMERDGLTLVLKYYLMAKAVDLYFS